MMRERPIPFSAPMVRAIIEGRKMMTRRVIKPQPADLTPGWSWKYLPTEDRIAAYSPEGACGGSDIVHCPYGAPGDRLRVNESWATEKRYDKTSPSKLPRQNKPRIWHLADGPKPSWAGRTRSSRFMVKWASRITLEITAVRVERVQDISAHDAILEGVIVEGAGMLDACDIASQALEKFRALWDSLNAKRGFGWATNPFVRVISFKRVKDERKKA